MREFSSRQKRLKGGRFLPQAAIQGVFLGSALMPPPLRFGCFASLLPPALRSGGSAALQVLLHYKRGNLRFSVLSAN